MLTNIAGNRVFGKNHQVYLWECSWGRSRKLRAGEVWVGHRDLNMFRRAGDNALKRDSQTVDGQAGSVNYGQRKKVTFPLSSSAPIS